MALCLSVIKYIKKREYDSIIVANPFTPTGMIAIQYMKMLGIRYYTEGDGGFPGKKHFVKDLIKQYIYHNAVGYFSTSQKHDECFLEHGVKPEKLIRYPFSSVFERDVLSQIPSDKEKKERKKALGIQEDKIVVAVGQMIPRKGFDILLKAWVAENKNFGLYLIGGKPTDEYIRIVEQNDLHSVHFLDFKSREELLNYYKAAELFVLPTREDVWGLVINEAMACGLPIISTNRCNAALEMIRDGVNGFIINCNDVELLTEKIKLIMSDDTLREKMAIESLCVAHDFTLEKMAERHIAVLSTII